MGAGKFVDGLIDNTVGAGMGLILGGINDRRQIKQQQRLTDMQVAANQKLTDYAYQKQLQMWKDTNYGAQKRELEEAGLNAGLLYGMGGSGGATVGNGGSGVNGGSSPVGGGEVMGMMQMRLMNAQKENIEADTELKRTNAEKTSGVDTENVKADTANKIAEQIIKDYTGKEVKDQYERIKAPGRSVEYKTYMDEMEARQGLAGTVYELWKEGKLHEKAISEIEAIALGNAKTRAEKGRILKQTDLLEQNIKGAKLDNMIKELEQKLMERVGIDRNSPWWIKTLGRFFADLVGVE